MKKKKKKMLKDVVHKELYKIYYKISIIIYSIDMYRHCFLFFEEDIDIVFGYSFISLFSYEHLN